jgi:murein L,D-transpeptidase YcbB/YkuD
MSGPRHRRTRHSHAIRWAGGHAAALLGLLAAPLTANAQSASTLWDHIQGLATPGRAAEQRVSAAERGQRAVESPREELRKDAVALLSEDTRSSLDQAVQHYREIVADGGWPLVPTTSNRTIRPGEEDERLRAVARRLLASGDLPPKPNRTVPQTYNAELEAAVKRFQSRHGMRASGLVDKSTIAVMNVPADVRLAQLRINQVRLLELARQLQAAERYVLVNVPAFALEAVESGAVVQRHRVIVGKPDRQTPGVKATIRNINFFPHWHVPESVPHLDLIPKLQKEPQYLAEQKIRALKTWKGEEIPVEGFDWTNPVAKTFKFQQDPGPQNALGLVRIDMPNEHTVYMHDTPMKQLFGQRGRAFSAGCVRVEGVFDLVAWILRDVPGWSEARAQIDVVINDNLPLDIQLPKPIPVHFVYMTAWATPDGKVEFRHDMYQRDGIQGLVASYQGEKPAVDTLAP